MSEEQKKTVEEAIETVLGEEAVEQNVETETETETVAEDIVVEQADQQAALIEELTKKLAAAEEEIKEQKDQVIRAQAFSQNEIRKAGIDSENRRKSVLRTFANALKAISSIGIQQINPIGETLDPEKHQAMSMQVVEGVAANQVVAVMQKGYELSGGQVIRPAMVVVSKAAV